MIISLKMFQWINSASCHGIKARKVFLKRCKDARNAEALYRKGMINYFSRRKIKSGQRYLKKAVEKGHVEAIYTYGIILICLGGELRKQGLQVVSSLNLTSSSKRSFKIASCRSKTEKFLRCMWVYVSLAEPKEYSFNNFKVVGCNCEHDITPRRNCFEFRRPGLESKQQPI